MHFAQRWPRAQEVPKGSRPPRKHDLSMPRTPSNEVRVTLSRPGRAWASMTTGKGVVRIGCDGSSLAEAEASSNLVVFPTTALRGGATLDTWRSASVAVAEVPGIARLMMAVALAIGGDGGGAREAIDEASPRDEGWCCCAARRSAMVMALLLSLVALTAKERCRTNRSAKMAASAQRRGADLMRWRQQRSPMACRNRHHFSVRRVKFLKAPPVALS